MAWLYLLHARFQRDKVDYRYRRPNGWFEKIDGEPKTWELARCVVERWGDNDPVRKNLELTIALRNKIEHRFDQSTALVTSGHAQALLLNYEQELTATFGDSHSLADRLRFPVFIGTFTAEGARQLVAAQKQTPRKISDLIASFTADLDRQYGMISVLSSGSTSFRRPVPRLTRIWLSRSFVMTSSQLASAKFLRHLGDRVLWWCVTASAPFLTSAS